jgi:anti-sigma regulatory factor (Ser/Thr protein kinase)
MADHSTAPRPVTVALPFEPLAARTARRLLTDFLVSAKVPSSVIRDAALVLSELVSNSLDHGRGNAANQLEVSWRLDRSGLRLSVHDSGGLGTPVLREIDARTARGRGLAIVAALSSSWSVDQADGTRVTAQLSTS